MKVFIGDIHSGVFLVAATVAVSHVDLELVFVARVSLCEHHTQHNAGVTDLKKKKDG